MKSRIIVTTLFLFIIIVSGSGQVLDNTNTKTSYKHALGASAGFTTGVGMAYQYWYNKLGAQITFYTNIRENNTQLIVGLTFFYTLVEVEHMNLFLYQGNSFYYNKRINYSGSLTEDSYFNNGLGIGIEFVAFERVGLSIMVGYGAYDNFTELNLTGETGLNFKF